MSGPSESPKLWGSIASELGAQSPQPGLSNRVSFVALFYLLLLFGKTFYNHKACFYYHYYYFLKKFFENACGIIFMCGINFYNRLGTQPCSFAFNLTLVFNLTFNFNFSKFGKLKFAGIPSSSWGLHCIIENFCRDPGEPRAQSLLREDLNQS